MRSAFVKELETHISSNKKLMLLTADLGFGVFDEIEKNYPEQYCNVGIAEQSMMGMAAGLSLEGYSVVAYSIANFATLRCLEQIRNDIAYHNLDVTIVASGGGFGYGQLGMSHHATEDLSIMRALPGTKVIAPGSEWEMREVTRKILTSGGLTYLRLDKSRYNESPNEELFIGRMRRVFSGCDLSIIATGGILSEAILARDALRDHSINAQVISCHSLKPIDVETVLDAALNTGGIVTLEEHNKIGGLGSAISEVCMDHNIIPKKFLRIGLDDSYSEIVGDQIYLRKHYGLDSETVVEKIYNLLKG